MRRGKASVSGHSPECEGAGQRGGHKDSSEAMPMDMGVSKIAQRKRRDLTSSNIVFASPSESIFVVIGSSAVDLDGGRCDEDAEKKVDEADKGETEGSRGERAGARAPSAGFRMVPKNELLGASLIADGGES